ncbi:MAG: hypothetical protein KatS3mg124_1886 [Porticoccaceae bacterium]|nr:MAG: hypothetical protein KatS3mg124_1886 [Porticoccaceae bacterium]
MKAVLCIFAMPTEIGDLARLARTLARSPPSTSLEIDLALALSPQLVDWKKSALPRSFFEDQLASISRLLERSFTVRARSSEDVLGCTAHRRAALERYTEADVFCWLDPDIAFAPQTLDLLLQGCRLANQRGTHWILTPELVRLWDATWDCLVNDQFRDKPLGYQKDNDPWADCGVKGPLTLESVFNRIPGQPRFKFAGGWFTCLSGELLRTVGIPHSFAPYGLEDTFIMWAAEYLTRSGRAQVSQYKVKNLVVCENYRDRDHSAYRNHLTLFDRREEFLAITRSVFQAELERFQ